MCSWASPGEGLNTRYLIGLTTLRIPAGEKRATETLTLIPINDDVVDEDIPIVISGNAGIKTVESATITLIDDDKESQSINLSAGYCRIKPIRWCDRNHGDGNLGWKGDKRGGRASP